MHADVRRARSLAALLDFLVPATAADALGLLATGVAWFSGPSSPGVAAWIWGTLAAGAVSAFLLRDAAGGRARRWLGLEIHDAAGARPGAWGSIRRWHKRIAVDRVSRREKTKQTKIDETDGNGHLSSLSFTFVCFVFS